MKISLLMMLVLSVFTMAIARNGALKKKHTNENKKDVTIWYDAFNKNDPALIDNILDATWVDIPSAANQKPGPGGVKELLVGLKTVFPDFNVRIEEILQDGNKVIVRSELTGTQRAPFMGTPSKGRRMTIHAV